MAAMGRRRNAMNALTRVAQPPSTVSRAARHLLPRRRHTYGGGVDVAVSKRFGALAGLIASAAVGVPVLLELLAGPVDSPAWVLWSWWACYLGYLVVFAVLSQVPVGRRPAWLSDRPLVVVQGMLGAVAYVLAPADGWAMV